MEENLHNDDFEKFLQEQVKHHRMFPSDKIWRNINNNIHKEYKWPALTIAAFALVVATVAVSLYFSPGPNIFATEKSVAKSNQPTKAPGTAGFNTTDLANSPLNDNQDYTSRSTDQLPTSTGITETKRVRRRVITQVSPKPAIQRENLTNSEIPEVLKSASESMVPIIVAGKPGETAEESTATTTLKSIHQGTQLKQPEDLSNLHEQAEVVSSGTKSGNNNKRFSYQVYITPSASYRSLKEDQSQVVQQTRDVGGPVAINYVSDVNEIVRHKPGTGIEVGVAFGYTLSNKFKLKTGVQLNARQYLINAFLAPIEVATIAYVSGRSIDSLTAYSSYRTSHGYQNAELTNRFYQLSIPVSLDYKVVGNNNIQLNVAAGLQPTYMLTQNSFLISTDFKNYIESPGMTRKWNLNANLESYLSIKRGSYNWQIGPQVRYQTLPASLKKYPIKEYLIDYGFKIGVAKSL